MGCVYRYKKHGQPTKIWWIKYYRSGVAYYESSHSPRKGPAIELLKTKEGDIARGLPVSPRIGKLRFEEAAADMVTFCRIHGQRSVDEVVRRIAKHLAPFFGGRRLAGVVAADVRAFIEKRQADTIVTRKARRVRRGGWVEIPEERRSVSPAEINRELTTLKRIFNLAVEGEKLLHRPTIKLLQEHNIRTGFFEPAQYASVLAHLPAPLRPVCRFAYITGWRIPSEVLPLQWRQVDFDAEQVQLDAGTTKNGEARVFPMTGDLRTLLEEQDADRKRLAGRGRICPWVFHRDGEPIKSLLKAFRTACKAAGCPGRIPHDFRRTAVRNLVRAGIPEAVAMTMTGHKTRSVFERYNIVSARDLTDAAHKLDAYTTKLVGAR